MMHAPVFKTGATAEAGRQLSAAGEVPVSRAALPIIKRTVPHASIPLAALLFIAPILAVSYGLASRQDVASLLLVLALAIPLIYGVRLFRNNFVQHLRSESAARDAADTIDLLLHGDDERGGDWLWQVDLSGQIVDSRVGLNAAAGGTLSLRNGTRFTDLFKTGPEHALLCQNLQSFQSFRQLAVESAGGDQRWWTLRGRVWHDEAGRVLGMRGVATDVCRAKAEAHRLNHLATQDQTTGLLNRRSFEEKLTQALFRAAGGDSLALFYVDLDNFKSVNQRFGQAISDDVLRTVALRITACLGVTDIVAHMGGDAFAMLIPGGLSQELVVTRAQTILSAINQPVCAGKMDMSPSASIGIAFGPKDGRTAGALTGSAQTALDRAKANGRNDYMLYSANQSAPRSKDAAAQERRRTA